MPYAILWDQVLRLVAYSAGMDIQFKPGFVLDDKVVGLTAASGFSRNGFRQIYIYIHPYKIKMLTKGMRGRQADPRVMAFFLHAVACHELTHADGRMGMGHSEQFVVAREDLGIATASTLRAIELMAIKILGMKPRKGTSESKLLKEVRSQLAKTKKQVKADQKTIKENERSLEEVRKALEMSRREVSELQQERDVQNETHRWKEYVPTAVDSVSSAKALSKGTRFRAPHWGATRQALVGELRVAAFGHPQMDFKAGGEGVLLLDRFGEFGATAIDGLAREYVSMAPDDRPLIVYTHDTSEELPDSAKWLDRRVRENLKTFEDHLAKAYREYDGRIPLTKSQRLRSPSDAARNISENIKLYLEALPQGVGRAAALKGLREPVSFGLWYPRNQAGYLPKYNPSSFGHDQSITETLIGPDVEETYAIADHVIACIVGLIGRPSLAAKTRKRTDQFLYRCEDGTRKCPPDAAKWLVGKDSRGKPVFPGGGVDPGETIKDAARRETIEETGRRPTNLRMLKTKPFVSQYSKTKAKRQGAKASKTYGLIGNAPEVINVPKGIIPDDFIEDLRWRSTKGVEKLIPDNTKRGQWQSKAFNEAKGRLKKKGQK